MSSTTRRKSAIITLWPRFLRRFRDDGPELVDGLAELEVAYQMYALVAPLPAASQARAIDHVCMIVKENMKLIDAFERTQAADAANAA